MFPSSSERREAPTMMSPLERANHWTIIEVIEDNDSERLALSMGPKRVCVVLLAPEDGNRSIFRNVKFSSI
jgi:hypothetical protein